MEIIYYFDAGFEMINDLFPESMIRKMVKSSAKELGLNLEGFYIGSHD